MNQLNSILAANRNFVRPGAFPPLPKNPKKQFAIFTCMDTRLVDFLEPAMGIKRGDAKVIKNAGNTLVDPLHGGVIRSLVAAIFMLGVEPADVPVHGLIFCPNNGRLEVMLDGYKAEGFDQNNRETYER
jgi:carbonic anhydrase